MKTQKTKDLEKLLNKVRYEIQKHINQGYDVEMLVPLEFDVSEWNLLLDHITKTQNNWNELKSWLEEVRKDIDKARKLHEEYSLSEERLSSKYFAYGNTLMKMQELEG